jgi:hypothetical protein
MNVVKATAVQRKMAVLWYADGQTALVQLTVGHSRTGINLTGTSFTL